MHRLSSIVLVVVLLGAGCGGEPEDRFKRPANVPPESRVVMTTAPAHLNGVEAIVGNAHGVAFTTWGNELRVLRPGRELVTKEFPRSLCPMTGGSALPRMHLLADRLVMYDRECGLWTFADGDATPRPIASTRTLTVRFDQGGGLDHHEWIWQGGATGPRTWLGPRVVFHGDSLFMCFVPPPTSASVVPNAEIWRTDIEGRGAPERVRELARSQCDVFLVDDDAIYIEDAAPRASTDEVFSEVIDRVDRRTGAVTRIGGVSLDASYVRHAALTRTHVYLLESGVKGDSLFARLHRIPKSGGPVEIIADDLRNVDGLRSDGESIFLAHESSILRFDGTARTKIVDSALLLHSRFAVGGGELVWDEIGVPGDDRDDAVFALKVR